MTIAYKRHTCDQCGETFKRGIRMDFLINKIVIREGEIQWDTMDDVEFFAFFCSRDCLMGYMIDNYYIPEGGTLKDLKEIKDGSVSPIQ
jgi:hypothetical protein